MYVCPAAIPIKSLNGSPPVNMLRTMSAQGKFEDFTGNPKRLIYWSGSSLHHTYINENIKDSCNIILSP